MSIRIKYLSLFILILVLANWNLGSCLASVEEAEASLAISMAEDHLGYTYLKLLEAERAGGDVTELTANLNIALDYLSKAKRAFEAGEFPTTSFLSREALKMASSLTNEAVDLKNYAENYGRSLYMNRLLTSAVLIFLTLMFSYLGWKIFKSHYVASRI
jgi:hypothetical protein